MRKYMLFWAAMLCLAPCAYGITAANIRWGQDVTSNMASNTLKQWTISMESRLGAPTAGTGNTYYVDSGVATEGDGKSWTNARNTLDEAIGLCTDNNGDVIYVAPGHAETWSAATSGVTCDVIGVRIIGCGEGSNRPTFTYTNAGATIDVSVANVTIENLRFVSGVSAVVSSITLAAGADYLTITGCEWVTPASAAYEFYDMITLATGSDYVTILGNRFVSLTTTTGCNQAINGDTGIVDRLAIVGNEFQGAYVVAAVHSDKVNTNMLVAGNVVHQATAGQFGLEFTAAATGILAENIVYTNSLATAIDPGSLACFENYCINTTDLSAARIPANTLDAIITDLAGISQLGDKVVADMDANSTIASNITANKVILDDLGGISQIGDKLVADMDANSTVLNLSQVGDKVVADMDANSTDLAILNDLGGISQVGDKVVADMDANSTTLAILTDLAGISQVGDKIVADMDANSTDLAILNDLGGISQVGDKVQADMDANSLLYWQERTAYTTADEVTSDLFTVAGGPILITSMVGYVDVLIGANATTCKLWCDTTAGASYDQDFSTAVNIETDAVGTTYIFSNANPAVLTPLTPGSAGASNLQSPWFCPVGTVEQLMSADPGGAGGDHITWYMTWKPLKAGITVAGVSP